jgi:bifunctional non-homologous end joining protein LigD
MLPITARPPIGQPGWVWEFKWDGIRVLGQAAGGRWRLITRHGRDVTGQFPELAGLAALGDVVVDGELVILAREGLALDFGAALRRLRARPTHALVAGAPATVIVFDVLRADGADVRARPWHQRRAILDGWGPGLGLEEAHWSVSPVFDDGAATLEASLANGLEGIVAKRRASPYRSGRSAYWRKHRHRATVDALVIGWRRNARGGLTLLLAEATEAGLAPIGSCRAPSSLAPVLATLAAPAPPIPMRVRGVQWVRPLLEVEVAAASREPDGRLRLPRFVRARPDQLD